MEDKILINGVWYKRCDANDTSHNDIEVDYTDYKGCIYETVDYCWEAHILIDKNGNHRGDLWIEFTDKVKRTEDIWDNPIWFKGVLENNPGSIEEAMESMDNEGVRHFKAFIKVLMEKGWLN
jgi:hypothetical protein